MDGDTTYSGPRATDARGALRRRPGWLRSYAASLPVLVRGVRSRLAVLRLALERGNRPVPIELRDGMVLEVRSLLELWVARATVLEREYEPPGIELAPEAVVLDVGASIGDFALAIARRGPARRVHAFEPEPAAFALLEANRRRNGIGNVTAHRVAVADRDGTAVLAVDRRRPVLNSLDPAPADPRPRLRVPCRRLDGLLDELEIGRCDLLKIDCEGAEPAILAGAGAGGMARVRAVSLEYHADAARDELLSVLSGHGFRVWHRPCPVWRGHGLAFAIRPAAAP